MKNSTNETWFLHVETSALNLSTSVPEGRIVLASSLFRGALEALLPKTLTPNPQSWPTQPVIPSRGILKARANALRKNQTPSEICFGQRLKEAGVNFAVQQVVGLYIADFVITNKALIIEIDGSSHTGREVYDEKRDNWLRSCGFEVWRIPNESVASFDVETVVAAPTLTKEWSKPYSLAKQKAGKFISTLMATEKPHPPAPAKTKAKKKVPKVLVIKGIHRVST